MLMGSSSLIATALEKHFPQSRQFGTIFPKSKNDGRDDTGLIKLFSRLVEIEMFQLAVILLAWEDLPESLVHDRASVRPILSLHSLLSFWPSFLDRPLTSSKLSPGEVWRLVLCLPMLSVPFS